MKTAMVVGLARSGIACAKLLGQNGWHLLLSDTRTEIPGLLESLADIPYTNALGLDAATLLDGIDLIVLSPGVSMFQPFVEQAKARGIEVIGEIELGYRYAKGTFLCITGTNGKTTCTALAGEICKRSAKQTYVLGNIGTPISQCAEQTQPGDLIVAETAALQLEGNSRFHAHVAAVTNISEDHMDRFLTMDYYIACKCKIFLNQTAEDFAVLNYDDPIVRNMAAQTPAHILYFSRACAVEEGVYLKEGVMHYRFQGTQGRLCEARELLIPGVHNHENAMLCAAMGLAAGVSPQEIREALITFPGVEHRIEFVCERGGVRYINDSKGTNPDSTMMAIAAMERPVVLLLGGYDKHNNFVELFHAIRQSGKVKAAVILGETAPKLLDAAQETGYQDVVHCEKTFHHAVDMAAEIAQPGDVVLLSPACASWDMFQDFEQRGKAFKDIVLAYVE